jgi:L-threonylcarbamoyladenylate synthase
VTEQAATPPIHAVDSAEGVAAAVAALRRDEIIAFPTDTLYGVGGNALSAAAVERVYQAKGREAGRGLPVLLADEAGVAPLVAEWPPAAEALARAFWPGALTLVVAAGVHVPALVRAGATVAVRVPGLAALRAVIRAAGVPLIGTSANRSGAPAALTAQAAAAMLGRHVALVLDGGRTMGQPSTVVSLAGGGLHLIREGAIPLAALHEALRSGQQAGPGVTG